MDLHGANVAFYVAAETECRQGAFEEERVIGPVGIVADGAVPKFYGTVDILFFAEAVTHETEFFPGRPEVFTAYVCAFADVAKVTRPVRVDVNGKSPRGLFVDMRVRASHQRQSDQGNDKLRLPSFYPHPNNPARRYSNAISLLPRKYRPVNLRVFRYSP